MKTAALAIALLMSSAAFAQTYEQPAAAPEQELDVDADVSVQPDGDLDVDADVDIQPDEPDQNAPTTTTTTTDTGTATMTTTTTTQVAMAPASGPVVQPGNADPEHDARGIAVISDPAVVPAGFNGVSGAALGGPLADPATGQVIDAADDSYPPCTAGETDNCVQTYEGGRSPQ